MLRFLLRGLPFLAAMFATRSRTDVQLGQWHRFRAESPVRRATGRSSSPGKNDSSGRLLLGHSGCVPTPERRDQRHFGILGRFR